MDEEETVLLGSSESDNYQSDGPSMASVANVSCSPVKGKKKKQLRKTRHVARERRGEVASEDVLYCKELSEVCGGESLLKMNLIYWSSLICMQ